MAKEKTKQVMYQGKLVEAIDMTPTWSAIVDIHIACLENPMAIDKSGARIELRRMAKLADERNEIIKNMKKDG